MKIAGLVLLGVLAAAGQDTARDSIALSDPSRPAAIEIDTFTGDITVRGHSGKDVVVETKTSSNARPRRAAREVDGLKRIDIPGNGPGIEQNNNTVEIHGGPFFHDDLVVLAPPGSSVRVHTKSGDITVEGITGAVEAHSLAGRVRLTNVEGSPVAHSLNGNIEVTVTRPGDKPMSFSTLNGNIDVTLPASTKARLKMKTDHGELFTDFDVKLDEVSKTADNGRAGGRLRMNRLATGAINGGGPEISFTTLDGQIRIRKGK